MFKFYTIPSKGIIDKLIGKNASIKLSSAFNLNDPYELKFNLELDPFEKGHEEKFHKDNPGSSTEDFKRWQEHALQHEGYTWYAEQQQRNAIAQTIALCSFTEDNKNNLMWSHYTDTHKGICIEYKPELFEHLKTFKNYLVFWKVKYSDIPPTVKALENINSKVEKMIFNKQSEWKYEKEHRVVFISNKDTEFISIDQKYIKAVYLGSRIEGKIKSEVLSLCTNTDINIYQGITLGNSYDVHFEEHKKDKISMRAFWG